MPAATALIAGNEPLPQLAEKAVREALKRTGGTHANTVILFLSSEFSRHAPAAVMAAARAAQCTQVFGGIAAGLCHERGWVLDRPAAAAMVLTGATSLAPADASDTTSPLLSCSGAALPGDWAADRPRFGTHFHAGSHEHHATLWQMGRTTQLPQIEARLLGARGRIACSSGIKPLGPDFAVTRSSGYDLHELDGIAALETLLPLLPPEWLERPTLPLHLINALIGEPGQACPQSLGLISVNPDGSLTLAAPIQPEQRIRWAIREVQAAEDDMHACLKALTAEAADNAPAAQAPDFALFFSCIGRGPYFYGGEDRDLQALTTRHPGMPLLGTYGTGQIAPLGGINRQMQNSVVTALFSETAHV